ncbi:MAG: cell envelope integrity protein TolA, partial [Clostridia bacterium]|nr:cell envelope integrity protein TolA [Clostridia bacterium]
RKHGINDFEEALAVFQQGKDMVMKEEADRQKAAEEAKRKGKIEKLNAERAEEAKTIEKQKQTAMIYGSEKYSCAIKQEMKPWKEKYDTAKQKADEMDRSAESLTVLSSLATSVYSYEKPVQEENWAIHGGIANAIAGPAAGLATAMDVQRRNAEAKAEAALDRQRRAKELASLQSDISSLRSSVYEGSGSVYKDMREAQKCIDNLENQLVELNDKLIDDSDTEKKFELLNFSNFKGSVRETGNIDVTGESTLTQDIFVATVKGWLDGSVKLTVLDKSNTPVAIGYFNVEYSPNVLDRNFKFNENSDTFGMTKNTQRTISALCAPIDGKSVSNTDGLTVMVEPVYMWIIED